MTLERILRGRGGFDHRQDPDPAKRRLGAHGTELWFVVRGPEGAVVLTVFTMWDPSCVRVGARPLTGPFPAGLSFHRAHPVRNGDPPSHVQCDWLADRAPCFDSQMSYTLGDRAWQRLVLEGPDGCWAELERLYRAAFDVAQRELQ